MWFEADPISPNFPNNDFSFAEIDSLPPDHVRSMLALSARDFSLGLRSSINHSDWVNNEPFLSADFSSETSQSGEGPGFASKVVDKSMTEDGPITVTGIRTYRLDSYSWYDSGPGADYWTVHSEWDGGGFDFVPDHSAIDVTINFDREMTASESAAFAAFLDAIEALTVAINALADDAEVRLPNGAYINGAFLKSLWAETDFIINDGFTYANGTQGGEARMLNGNPTVSFNIRYLDEYDNFAGGINYLIAHDFAHLTQYDSAYYQDQLTANDLAREILYEGGLVYLPNPGFGYSTIVPFGFSTPNGDGGEGSGGSGGGGDYIP
jgi:hypothetical protein